MLCFCRLAGAQAHKPKLYVVGKGRWGSNVNYIPTGLFTCLHSEKQTIRKTTPKGRFSYPPSHLK